MIENKRFYLQGDYLVDDEGMKYAVNHCSDATKTYLVFLLNELHEQIQSQSIVIQDYQERCDEVFEKNERLELENETLKSNYQRDIQSSIDFCNNYSKTNSKLLEEIGQLKQQLSDIKGQLLMLDNCDNWDYDRMKHTVREIAKIIGYSGTINPKK